MKKPALVMRAGLAASLQSAIRNLHSHDAVLIFNSRTALRPDIADRYTVEEELDQEDHETRERHQKHIGTKNTKRRRFEPSCLSWLFGGYALCFCEFCALCGHGC